MGALSPPRALGCPGRPRRGSVGSRAPRSAGLSGAWPRPRRRRERGERGGWAAPAREPPSRGPAPSPRSGLGQEPRTGCCGDPRGARARVPGPGRHAGPTARGARRPWPSRSRPGAAGTEGRAEPGARRSSASSALCRPSRRGSGAAGSALEGVRRQQKRLRCSLVEIALAGCTLDRRSALRLNIRREQCAEEPVLPVWGILQCCIRCYYHPYFLS